MGKVVELKSKKVKEPVVIQDNDVKGDVADIIAYTHLNLLFDLMRQTKADGKDSIALTELEALPQKAIDKVVQMTVKRLEELEKELKEKDNG